MRFTGTIKAATIAGVVLAVLISPSTVFGVADVLPADRPLRDLDHRGGRLAPTAEALSAAAGLGAVVRWNRFGTPQVLYSPYGFLATGYSGAEADAARDWVRDNGSLFGLSSASVDSLELARQSALAGSTATVVEFRQRAGALRLAQEGSIKVGLVDGSIFWVSSSSVGEIGDVAAPTISAAEAWLAAASDVNLAVSAGELVPAGTDGDWTLFEAGLTRLQRARLVALAVPGLGAIPAYETIVVDYGGGQSIGYSSFVDAETGAVLVRRNRVQRALADWRFFAANPLLDHSTIDTRALACWFDPSADCDLELDNGAARVPWDQLPGAPTATFNTTGNNAESAEARCSPLTPCPPSYRPVSPTREYDFPWFNEWFDSSCDPGVILSNDAGADLDAAVTNLFAMHNRMHDWSYFLGFTEINGNAQVNNFGLGGAQGDPELGNAQAAALNGGYPAYLGRDNANQLTLNDGIPPESNMYLWQSIAGAVYVPCVDGDYDAAVIAHEYGHLIQNRMIDPEDGIAGDHGSAMGESWSDLTAIEYLNAYGFVPIADENPYAVGAYITGKKESGIRNYGMNASPLNFSNMDFDPVGQFAASPHANGEIWSAVNFDIRAALAAKYDATFPSSDALLQQRCADNEIPSDLCPGNRRWVQIFHDAFLLAPRELTMVDARDAYMAADFARANDPSIVWPSNHDELADAFGRRGFGVGASAAGTGDVDPVPSFESASGANAAVTFYLVGADEGDFPVAGEVFVGSMEAYAVPVADTHGSTGLGDSAVMAAGSYEFLARAEGYGHFRFEASFAAGEVTTVRVRMPSNWASGSRGALATGDGIDHDQLIDETEESNWENNVATGDIVGSAVTVELAGGAHEVSRVQVSAMPELGENRFTTLRQFAIETCDETAADCTDSGSFSRIYTSASDAFPAFGFRPIVPDWLLRSFDVPPTMATHVRLVTLNNQCTGNLEYQDPIAADADPLNPTDCRLGDELGGVLPDRDRDVRVAELQVFSTTQACLDLPAKLAVVQIPDGLEPLTGDGDLFVDNCEDHNLHFAIANHGSVGLTGIEVLDVRPTSHSGIVIHTPLPFGSAPLASGCETDTDYGFGTFHFTANGLTAGDTIRFEVDVTANEITGVQTGTLEIANAENDFATADVSFDFEADTQGWDVVNGVFDRTDTPAPGAPAPTGIPAPSLFYMASSVAEDDACDQVRSPVLRLSPTSTLSLWNQYEIEPGDEILLGFYDRANVGLVDPASESRSVITPDGGARGYNVPDGAANGACASGEGGWSGPGPGWLDATWSASALAVDALGPNGRLAQIDVKYASDPLASLTGFQFDSVLVTDVLVNVADGGADICETGGNQRPIAADDAAATTPNTAVVVDVLANDSDPDGDPIAVAALQSPTAQGGTASDNGDGTVTYDPPSGFSGLDTFSYQVCDGGNLCDSATVSVTVGAPNQAPSAVNDYAVTDEDMAVTIAVLANDSDPDGDSLTVSGASQPANGTAVVNADGSITYTPNAGFFGTDAFTYTVSDGRGGSASATVSVNVRATGDDPDDDGDSDSDSDDADSDGVPNSEDSDDDNDGDSDNSDSDDDGDGIADEFDSPDNKEKQSSKNDNAAPNLSSSYTMKVTEGSLLLVALVESAQADMLTVEIHDPTGSLVGTSVPAPGRALATTVPLSSGDYTVTVRNAAAQVVNYDITLIGQVPWPAL